MLVNTTLVLASCITQIDQYGHSVAGVIPAFAAAGLLFALLQFSLQMSSIRTMRKSSKGLTMSHWNAWTQAATYALLIATNFAMLFMLSRYDVSFVHWTSLVVLAIWAATFAAVGIRYKGAFSKPKARLYSSIGIKVVPQALQGIGYAAVSAAGMSAVSISVLLLQSIMKFLLGRQTRKHDEYASASYGAASWDLGSVAFMAICWSIGTLLA